MADREFSSHGRKGSGDEISGVVVRGGSQLSGRVVTMIRDVVDLDEQLGPLLQLIMRSGVQHSVTRREASTEIVNPVGLMQIVLVAARKGSSNRIEIEVDRDSCGGLIVGKCLERLLRLPQHIWICGSVFVPVLDQTSRSIPSDTE